MPSELSKVEGSLLVCPLSYIPSHFPPHVPHSERPMAYVVITDELPILKETASDKPPRSDVLLLEMREGKKGQAQFLKSILPKAIPYIDDHLSKGAAICIGCHNGKDASVGVALTALQMFFDDEGNFVTHSEEREKAREFLKRKNFAAFVTDL